MMIMIIIISSSSSSSSSSMVIIIIIYKISCGLRVILSRRCKSNSSEIYISIYNYWEFLQTVRKNALTQHL